MSKASEESVDMMMFRGRKVGYVMGYIWLVSFFPSIKQLQAAFCQSRSAHNFDSIPKLCELNKDCNAQGQNQLDFLHTRDSLSSDSYKLLLGFGNSTAVASSRYSE